MPVPKSIIKVNKNGVTYTSNVDAVNFTIKQLSIGALKDVGKALRMMVIYKLRTLPGFKKVLKGGDRITNAIRYNVTNEPALQLGFIHNTWYGAKQELGDPSTGMPKKAFLRDTVYNNIPLIVEIESKYLSAINDESNAINLAEKIESEGNKQDKNE